MGTIPVATATVNATAAVTRYRWNATNVTRVPNASMAVSVADVEPEVEHDFVMVTEVIRATPKFIESTEEKVTLLVYLIVNSLVALAGNSILAATVCASRSLRNMGNIFYLNLAVADLLMVVVMVLATVSVFGEQFWYIDEHLCDAWMSLESCAAMVVILSIEALTANIHMTISSPLRYNRLVRHRFVLVAIVTCIWVISLLATAVPVVLRWHEPSDKQQILVAGSTLTKCRFTASTSFAAVKTGIFVLHCSVILLLNARLYFYARSQLRKIRKFQSVSNAVACQLIKSNSLPHTVQKQINFFGLEIDSRRLDTIVRQQPSSHRKKSCSLANVSTLRPTTPTNAYALANRFPKSKRLKAIKTLTAMLLNFFICWFPFNVVTMVNSACQDCVSDDVDVWITMLAFLNASTNPIIYTVCNKELREVLQKLLFHRRPPNFGTESRSTHSFDIGTTAVRRSSFQETHPLTKTARTRSERTSIDVVLKARTSSTDSGSTLRRINSCGNLVSENEVLT